MKPTIEQVLAYAQADLDAPKSAQPPSPYEIALAIAGALISTGKYEDPGAVMKTAWLMVIPFYQGQADYLAQAKALADVARRSSGPDVEMTAAEARSYVTGGDAGGGGVGGETGDIGEVGGGEPLAYVAFQVPPPHSPEQQNRIANATLAAQAAARDLENAKHLGADKGRAARVAKAQKAFDAAAKAQSEAYL